MNLKLLPSFRETIQLSIDVLCIHIGRLVRSVGYFKDFLFAHFLEFCGIGGIGSRKLIILRDARNATGWGLS